MAIVWVFSAAIGWALWGTIVARARTVQRAIQLRDLVIVHDKNNRALDAARKAAVDSQTRTAEFMAFLCHEMRNPLHKCVTAHTAFAHGLHWH
jgi:hypothetical protein